MADNAETNRCAIRRRAAAGGDRLHRDGDDVTPRSLRSIARLNIARSRVRPSIWSLTYDRARTMDLNRISLIGCDSIHPCRRVEVNLRISGKPDVTALPRPVGLWPKCGLFASFNGP